MFSRDSLSSGQQDLNLRPLGPQPSALPSYAIPRRQEAFPFHSLRELLPVEILYAYYYIKILLKINSDF